MTRLSCAHSRIRPIHGDEINAVGGARLQCIDCRRYLEGSVLIAYLRKDEAARVESEWYAERPLTDRPDVEAVMTSPHTSRGEVRAFWILFGILYGGVAAYLLWLFLVRP